MKLTELNPVFLSCGGSGVYYADGRPMPATSGVGVMFDCPCGDRSEEHRCYVPFANPIGPGPLTSQKGWQRTGDTFETLTLTPSILRVQSRGGCDWHGFITNGEVRTV